MSTTKYIVNNSPEQTINGNIGIGTTPSVALDVVGDIHMNGNEIQTVKYKVYTALLTQSGTSSIQTIDSGNTVIGVTYQIDASVTGDDFRDVGGPLITYDSEFIDDYFVATGTIPSNWTNTTVLRFNTGAPVVTVLENTIGNIWWAYFNIGDYACWSDNLFTIGKTTVFIGPENYSISDTSNLLQLVVFAEEQFTDYIEFLLCDPNGRIDDGLINKSIEIRVYN